MKICLWNYCSLPFREFLFWASTVWNCSSEWPWGHQERCHTSHSRKATTVSNQRSRQSFENNTKTRVLPNYCVATDCGLLSNTDKVVQCQGDGFFRYMKASYKRSCLPARVGRGTQCCIIDATTWGSATLWKTTVSLFTNYSLLFLTTCCKGHLDGGETLISNSDM